MLTTTELNRMRRIWVNTSDPVRRAIEAWIKEAQHGDLVAEKEAQAFLRLYAQTNNGMRAFEQLHEDKGEQLRFE